MFDRFLNTLLLTSDHASTFELQLMKKRLLDQLKDQIVTTTINGTPDVATFLETASRILHNFKEDKVSRNSLLLLTWSRIILILPPVLKSCPYFPVYGQNCRFSPYTEKYGSEATRDLTYFMQCLTWFKWNIDMFIKRLYFMVRSVFRHILNNCWL